MSHPRILVAEPRDCLELFCLAGTFRAVFADGFVILIGIPVGIAWAAGWFRKPSNHVLALVLGGVFVFCVFIVLAIGTSLIRVFTKDFVVPYMAVEGLTVMDGWRRLWSAMKTEKGAMPDILG